MPQPWPQPAPRIVKVPDFAEIAESARAGMVVSTAEVPTTARARAAPRRRLAQLGTKVLAAVGEEDMTISIRRQVAIACSTSTPTRQRRKEIDVTNVMFGASHLRIERDLS